MDLRFWFAGQIVIDAVMVFVLLWFGWRHARNRGPWKDFSETMGRAEAVLSEMREIGASLEKNLNQKRELSQDILEKLDQGLMRAEESYTRLCRVMGKCGTLSGQNRPAKEVTHTTSSIRALLEKGLSKEEIAQHLGISVSEIDLLLRVGHR